MTATPTATPAAATPAGSTQPALDLLYATICGFLMPFFLAAAGGNSDAARTAILDLIAAYNPSNLTELDLAGRIIGFSIVAMDNLRLSFDESLSAAKVLRYRSNAVALSRASEQARRILEALQARRETAAPIPRPIPRPTVAPAPAPAIPRPAPAPARQPEPPRGAAPAASHLPPADIEAMKRDARIMMAAFSKGGIQASTAIGAIPDPAMFGQPAAAALAAARRG